MKCATFALFLLTAVSAFADEEKPAAEPAELVKARQNHQAEIKAALDPITASYLKQLDALMKSYGAKGDLESAQAARAEIRSLAEKNAKSRIVGKWSWADTESTEFFKDGTCRNSRGPTGKWKHLEGQRYEVRWNDKRGVMYIVVSDAIAVKGQNGKVEAWRGIRLDNTEKR